MKDDLNGVVRAVLKSEEIEDDINGCVKEVEIANESLLRSHVEVLNDHAVKVISCKIRQSAVLCPCKQASCKAWIAVGTHRSLSLHAHHLCVHCGLVPRHGWKSEQMLRNHLNICRKTE